ncbi:PREDICTED: adhesion G protein-coupled receptor L4-like isoform X2 [Amphimedon queenslandica]|uniref:G-protein coupled receptors family 2 profile 2 domain-containing protein n=1 Tax=Amphimedon queenslandica TaxID=400682 RepID=A0A1X7UAQ7_AMPQE|nr:PREDICTED: adhesion G protein-coupled receptor L4-like isoform X2 [Amphimedon queenslandica]|eukprot:XP_019855360.1 PREDICTED: adhesion G protein-coupled receptor L4-like isoform X2 [Amphimedon queenslandica]
MLLVPFFLLFCLYYLSIANNCDRTEQYYEDAFPIINMSSCPLSRDELHCNHLGQTCNGSCTTKQLFYQTSTMEDFVVLTVYQLQYITDEQAFTDAVDEFRYLCDTGYTSLGLNVIDCVRLFIGLCVSSNEASSCMDQLYRFCVPATPTCIAGVEYTLLLGLNDQCQSSNCDKLITDILNSPLKFSTIDRLAALLHGESKRATRAITLHEHLTSVLDTFEENAQNVSNLVDNNDAQVFLKTMDNAFGDSHISNLSLSLLAETGPKTLTHLMELNQIFGMAILSGGGRIESNLTFSGSNLDVLFQITDNKDLSFQHTSANNETSVDIDLPRTALCQNLSSSLVSLPLSSSSDDSTRSESNEDILDTYFNCYPPPFPSDSCKYVVVSSYAQNIEGSFEEISNRTLVSPIVSVQVSSETNATIPRNYTFELFEPISLTFNISTEKFNYTAGERPLCHYWNTLLQNWSTDGMTTTIHSSSQVHCTSNHLTSFAVLVDHSGVIETVSDGESLALSIIGYAGPVISIIALIITLILLILLRKKLQKGPLLYVHVNLSLSLLLALLVFVLGIELPKSIPWLCSVVAGLLHYLFLCVFCWSLAEGIMLYILLIKVYGSLADKWYLLLPLGWGVPIIIVGISAGINYDLYGTENYCWLSFNKGMLWSFVGPILLIILINCIFLSLTIYHIIRSRMASGAEQNLKRTELVKSAVKGIIVLLPLLGITWIIGILTVNQETTVFLWLFTVLNSLQGVGILFLHVLRNQYITNWFKNKVKNWKSFSTSGTNEMHIKSFNKNVSGTSVTSTITYT